MVSKEVPDSVVLLSLSARGPRFLARILAAGRGKLGKGRETRLKLMLDRTACSAGCTLIFVYSIIRQGLYR